MKGISRNRRLRRYVLCVVAAASASCVGEPDGGGWSLQPGEGMPEFEVTLTDGTVVRSGDLRGAPSMIVLFNTGCPDCRAELPVVQEVSETVEGVNYLCISRGEEAGPVMSFWQSEGLTLPVAAVGDWSVYRLFAESIIPRIYIFDAGGTLVASWSDYPLATAAELTSTLTTLLGSGSL